VSEWTVVRKEDLRGYENYIYFMGLVGAMAIASVVQAVVSKSIQAFIAAGVFLAIFGAAFYLTKDSFPTVRKAFEDARGGSP